MEENPGFKNDFSKEEFLSYWNKDGYTESFDENSDPNIYHPGDLEKIRKLLDGYQNLNFTALDIGCGSGLWTIDFLSKRFCNVIALDLIKKPKFFSNQANISFVEVPSRDYTCFSVADSSIDFVWSFGLFCHLSPTAIGEYLKNIKRVLRKGRCGIAMFCNWRRHPYLKPWPKEPYINYPTDKKGGFFYNDTEIAAKLIEDAGLVFVADAIPDFRDTLAVFRKD